MEESLARVRSHANSKIASQTRQAAVLQAVEQTLREEGQSLTPAAYFASLTSLLDRGAAAEAAGILVLVVPYVSQALLVEKLDIVVAKLVPILTDGEADTALVRSAIGVLEAVLAAADPSVWAAVPLDEPGPLRTWACVLTLAQDSRPKIRRRAVEAVTRVLSTHNRHPGSDLALMGALEASSQSSARDTAKVVHGLQLLRAVVERIELDSSRRLAAVTETVLDAVRTSDQYAVLAALEVFGAVFGNPTTGLAGIKRTLELLIELRPAQTDKQVAPAWCAVIAQAYNSLANTSVPEALKALLPLTATMVEYLAMPPAAVEVVESASQCLCSLLSSGLLPSSLLSSGGRKVLGDIGEVLFGLLHARFHESFNAVCNVFVTYFDCSSSLAAEIPKNGDIVRVVAALRSGDLRAGADAVVAAAIRNAGPEAVLDWLPLQLSGDTNSGGRAWMLPLLRDNVQHAHLSHFTEVLVPLAQQYEQTAKRIGNERNSKILITVVDQIWALWPRYCDLPMDLSKALTRDTLQLILARLYERPSQRAVLCQGLRLLVESNLIYSQGEIGDEVLRSRFSPTQAEKSLRWLAATYGADILKALLNVFSSMTPESRGFVLDVINAYLAVIDSNDVEQLFDQISSLLATTLSENKQTEAYTMMDLVVAISAYLPPSHHQTFAHLFRTVVTLPDALLQKKAYRALTRLLDDSSVDSALSADIRRFVLEKAEVTLPQARRTRLTAITALLSTVPDSDLGAFVFGVVSEAMLATRDPNEKSREAAFTLLVAMAARMATGTGVIDHSQLAAFEDDEKTTATAAEYVEMIMGGLVGNTPHMVAAAVTALSRVVYEFRDILDPTKIAEYSDLVWMLLQSPTREIVGAVLGFVKVSILVLPAELIVSRLQPLLEGLLEWSNEHKMAFKAKVRHIIERLIRRLGYDTIAAAFPEKHAKLLQNIHKSKERAKRKLVTGDHSKPEPSSANANGRKFDNELDEALYGSSSDSENDDDQGSSRPQQNGERGQKSQKKQKSQQLLQQKRQDKKNNEQYIVAGAEPLDLLGETALAHISSNKPQAPRKKQLSHRLPQKDGKLLIRDEDDTAEDAGLEHKEALAAYADAVRQGPVRTQRGKLRFKKNKRGGEDLEDDATANVAQPSKVTKTRHAKPRRPARRGLH